MLILNAGIVLGRLEQVYGLEKHFVVNHLGHFLLTTRVLDLVKAAPQGRVVAVGSGNHRDAPQGGIQFDDSIRQELGGQRLSPFQARERPVLAGAVEAFARHAGDIELPDARTGGHQHSRQHLQG